MSVYEVIRLASNVSCIVPLVVYVSVIKKAEKFVHTMGLLVLISGLADLITFFKPAGVSTALVFNIQDILQFSLIATFYYLVIYSKPNLVTWCITVYATILVAVTLWIQGFLVFQTLMWTVSGLVTIVLAIAFLIHLVEQRPERSPSLYATLWINAGLLFYFGLSLWLFVMGDYILNELDDKTKMVFWNCHNANNIIKNVIIAIGIKYGRNG